MKATIFHIIVPFTLAIALAITSEGVAQNDPMLRHQMVRADPMTDYEQFSPTRMPDRINLTWNGDPATTQAVSWRTDTEENSQFAQIAKAADGPFFTHDTHWASIKELETNLGIAQYHSVVFEDLDPDTKYMYRVGDGINWSEWYHFSTASDDNEPFSFVYWGDWQEDVKSQSSRIARQAYRDLPDASFWMYAGDLIDNAHNDGEWGEWFHAHGFIAAMVPMIPSPGNHEWSGGELSIQWRPQFNLPDHGPDGAEEIAYYIDHQGARIISLDSRYHRTNYRELRDNMEGDGSVPPTPQTEWVEEVLEENPNEWTIVVFHYPVFASQPGRDNPSVREQWKPLFDEYQVDLVLQGHDHSYYRTGAGSYEHEYRFENDEKGVDYFDPNSGTVYVTSMAGSKQRDLKRQDWMARASEDLQLYHLVHVDTDSIRFESKTATGKLYDAFSIHKRPGDEPNEIIEQIPEGVEEVLRSDYERKFMPGSVRPWFYHERRFVDPPR